MHQQRDHRDVGTGEQSCRCEVQSRQGAFPDPARGPITVQKMGSIQQRSGSRSKRLAEPVPAEDGLIAPCAILFRPAIDTEASINRTRQQHVSLYARQRRSGAGHRREYQSAQIRREFFGSTARLRAAPKGDMLRIVQSVFERPKLIKPTLATCFERGLLSSIVLQGPRSANHAAAMIRGRWCVSSIVPFNPRTPRRQRLACLKENPAAERSAMVLRSVRP